MSQRGGLRLGPPASEAGEPQLQPRFAESPASSGAEGWGEGWGGGWEVGLGWGGVGWAGVGEALPQLWGSALLGTGQQSVLGPVVPGGPSGAGLPVSSQEGPEVPALECASPQPVATAGVGT